MRDKQTDSDSLEDALAGLDASLHELPPDKAPGLAVIGALKALFARARQKSSQLNRARGGKMASEFFTDAADQILRRLLDFAGARARLRPGTPGVALLTMGSFGRREPAPYSDVDLLVLYTGTDREQLETLIGNLLRPLWDAGLQLGHAVRTREECLAALEDHVSGENALETATSLMEARFVAGDVALGNLLLKRDLSDFFKRRGQSFVEAKLEEALLRHHRQGDSVYRTQPNLKDSPGALRDYQLAMWIDRASQLSGHLPRLSERPLVSPETIEEAGDGHARLLTFRIALHTACGRKQDVLDFAMQQALAEELGYEPTEELRSSELLLGDYFRAATAVHRLADTVIRRYREEQAVLRQDVEQLRRRPVDEEFTRIGDYLYCARPQVLAGPDWLEVAMRAFLHASHLGIGLSQEIRSGIRARLPELDEKERANPEAAQLFRALLQRRFHVAAALRSMRDVGLLGEYLPEFGQIQGLVIHDVLHDFTVDEHTLFAVEQVDRLLASNDPADRVRHAALEQLKGPELLRLAVLCHDLGKSRGGAGHSLRGALMVPPICERLGLPEAEARTLIFVVENHLLLSRISTRRDTGEGGLLDELAAKIGTRERLDLLYLLTCADSAAVGQGSFPAWKDELVSELYLRLDKRLTGEQPAATPEAVGLAERLAAEAKDDAERAAVREHCARVPPRYLLEVTLEEARLHLELLRRMKASGREVLAAVKGEGDLVDIWVVSTDRPRRFSQICGAFLGCGVNLVSAIAFTRNDGLILDHFRAGLTAAFGVPTGESRETYWARVAAEVENALEGRGDFRARIEQVRRRIPRVPVISRRVTPEVRIDNKLSERFTVIDVVCGDRIGLLYGLTRALGDLGCDIHFAKIDTQQGLATDVFYVTEVGGGRVQDAEKTHNIRLLLQAVADEFQEARR